MKKVTKKEIIALGVPESHLDEVMEYVKEVYTESPDLPEEYVYYGINYNFRDIMILS